MTVKELSQTQGFTCLNPEVQARPINGGICCDLLSWVMAKGQEGMAWITVQTHMNVVAVAVLHDFSCIILSEGNHMAPDVLAKATEEGIAVLETGYSSYRVCGILAQAGVE
jgi:hypothetical protein